MEGPADRGRTDTPLVFFRVFRVFRGFSAGRAVNVGGIIVCGGRSSRMGRPKAWLPFGEELMLPRVARLLGETAAPLVVVAAPGQDVPPLPSEIAVVRDEEEGRGPLQG